MHACLGHRRAARARRRARGCGARSAALHLAGPQRGLSPRQRTAAAPAFLPAVKLRGLYAVTPEGADLERKLRAALAGGVACVQYRRKAGNAAEAEAVVRLCREFGVPAIVNDDVELALEVGADGAHLGRDDGDLAAARRRLGKRILGASCYADMALA